MPILLSTNQIDGYIAWQPYVSVATESGIGQLVTYTKDFPPVPEWNNHPCCVLTARNDLVAIIPTLSTQWRPRQSLLTSG